MGMVITLATSKGGCGKSTIAIMLAGAYAQENARVLVIDVDPKQRIVKWAKSDFIPENLTVMSGNQDTIAQQIVDNRNKYEVIIIDVEGSGNLAAGLASALSNIVLIPANPSIPDVEDAYATVNMIKNQELAQGRSIPYALIWNRVPPAIITKEMQALYADVEAAGLKQLFRINELSAYRAVFSYSTTLANLDPSTPNKDKAVNQALQLALAVGEYLTTLPRKEAA
ncbi:ParA family protein [Asticcacaulis sp. W401b]|uniref:ParA family protein n=1 Tax=Asticcacaulis sp. W401b TaxID=3388666 RepID=UPI003970C21A